MADVTVTWQRGGDPRLDVSHLCPHCGSSEHGRPSLRRGGFVSLSHVDDLHLFATSDAAPVGVDIDAVDATKFNGFDGVVLHPHERAHAPVERAVTWTRKESLLKATGDGLTVDPRLVRLSDPDASPVLLEWSGGPAPHTVWMFDVAVADGYRAALTVISPEEPEVVVRTARP